MWITHTCLQAQRLLKVGACPWACWIVAYLFLLTTLLEVSCLVDRGHILWLQIFWVILIYSLPHWYQIEAFKPNNSSASWLLFFPPTTYLLDSWLFQLFMCSQTTWESCEKADSDSGVLERGPDLFSLTTPGMQVQSDLHTFLLESLGFLQILLTILHLQIHFRDYFYWRPILIVFSPILIRRKLHWYPLCYLLNSNEI